MNKTFSMFISHLYPCQMKNVLIKEQNVTFMLSKFAILNCHMILNTAIYVFFFKEAHRSHSFQQYKVKLKYVLS